MDILEELKMDGVGGCKTESKVQKGNKGDDGINRGTGGGASGGAQPYGAYGNSESGSATDANRIHDVYAYGGAGGSGTSYSGGNSGQTAIGGPNRNEVITYINGAAGSNLGGTGGGLLIIYGDSILNNGNIYSNGKYGQYGNGTGGGSINIFYKNQIIQGTMQATRGGNGSGNYGAEGGEGTVTIFSIIKEEPVVFYRAGETGVENWRKAGESTNIIIQETPYLVLQTYQVGIADLYYNEPINIENFNYIKIEKEHGGTRTCKGFDVILGTSPGNSDIMTYSINNLDEINNIPINNVEQKDIYFGLRLTTVSGDSRTYNIKSIQFLK